MKKTLLIIYVAAAFVLTACEKVSPTGLLLAGTGVEDRVEMSYKYYKNHKSEYPSYDIAQYSSDGGPSKIPDYTFLVGADSHVTTDLGRMNEMFDSFLDNNDKLIFHLGDIADTKADYYINLENCIEEYKRKFLIERMGCIPYNGGEDDFTKFVDPYSSSPNLVFSIEDNGYSFDPKTMTERNYRFPFFCAVGNHDLTHNGWGMWSNIFHSSFYDIYVYLGADDNSVPLYDHYICLDTASGTMGKKQVELINEGIFEDNEYNFHIRHTFVFTHTNIFRPMTTQFSSTYAREETFFILDLLKKWNTTACFYGHVHKWDDREYNGVRHITLDSMSERNSPDPGKYLVRVHCYKDGTVEYERVQMNYVKSE